MNAAKNLRVCIPLSRGAGDWRTIGHALATAGAVLAALGKLDAALRALAACEALCKDAGFGLELAERTLFVGTVAELQQAIGDTEFERTWAEWAAAAPEWAVSLVLDDLG